jgi:hypothetical protein
LKAADFLILGHSVDAQLGILQEGECLVMAANFLFPPGCLGHGGQPCIVCISSNGTGAVEDMH